MDNNKTIINEDKTQLAISKKSILQSLQRKAIKCSKKTILTISEIMEAIFEKDFDAIKSISEKCIPDDPQMLRALIWKINLGYLSLDNDNWEDYLKEKREKYNFYKTSFINLLKSEIANSNYQSRKLLEDIIKDVNRTHMGFSFFFQPVSKNKQFSKEELKTLFHQRQNCMLKDVKDIYKLDIEETHADVLARILYIYSKFTPDLLYHQGMNEILAPIYYCFSYDKVYQEETEETIEADTFWSFYLLMEQIRSSFDDSDEKGTEFKAELLKKILQVVDKEVYDRLIEYDVKFEFFAYRWFISFFSQDFQIGDILRLWDLVFSHENKYYYIFYVSIGILEYKREKILKSEMSEIMMEMQSFEDINVDRLIKLVRKLKEEYDSIIKPIIDEMN